MTIEEMQARWEKTLTDARAITDAALKEDRDLTGEEKSAIEKAMTEAAQQRDTIKLHKSVVAEFQAASQPVGEPRTGRTPVGAAPRHHRPGGQRAASP